MALAKRCDRCGKFYVWYLASSTGGEKPLCPFWHCLKPEIEKHDKTREEAVK